MFQRIKYSSSKLSRENRLTFLKNKYGFITKDEMVSDDCKRLITLIEKHCPSGKIMQTYPRPCDYNQDYSVMLMVIFKDKGEAAHFVFLDNLKTFDID